MYTINFVNNNPDIPTPYVTFIQAPTSPANLNATYGSGTQITNCTSYPLALINYTLSMDPTDWQGHMYLSDADLHLTSSCVDPAYTLTTDTRRYQNLEFAGSATRANPDITYINWYSIPLMMESTSESPPFNTRGAPKSQAALDALLAALAGLSGNNPTTVVTADKKIVRVISPNAGLPSWLPLYPTFTDYLVSVFIDSTDPVLLNNTYDGINNPPSPDFQPQTYTVTSFTPYNGLDLTITGTTSVLGKFTMTSRMIFRQFSNVIYLAVMKYAWSYSGASNPNGNTGDNNVFSAISRDLMAGFAYGFIGSTKWGSQPSSAWQGAASNQIFSAIQPDHPYYNPWANAINTCFTDVYTFPFNDFLTNSAPELGVNVGDTLTVTLLAP